MLLPAAAADDGDTVTIGGIRFRFDGVDAPEIDQMCLDEHGAAWPCGIEAANRLKEFINRRHVQCEDKGDDTAYPGRRIGICRIEGEAATLNEWLVRSGFAINFEPYAKGRFMRAEADARSNLLGMWKGCFTAPRDFRRWNKPTATLLGNRCAGDGNLIRNRLFPDHPDMPQGCSIKGKLTAHPEQSGHRGIYHVENCRSYRSLKTPNRWFCSEEDARAAGFRKAFNC